MTAVLILIDNIVDIYIFTLLAYVIASWLVAFRIINPWQPFVRWLLQALGRLHEPLLGRIRSVLPDLGGILFLQLLRKLVYFLQFTAQTSVLRRELGRLRFRLLLIRLRTLFFASNSPLT